MNFREWTRSLDGSTSQNIKIELSYWSRDIFRDYEKAASAPKVCFRFLILIATFGRILHCFALIHIRIQYRKTVWSIQICTFTCLGLKYSKIRKYEMRKMRPEVTSYFAYCARSFGFSDSSRRFRGNPSLVRRAAGFTHTLRIESGDWLWFQSYDWAKDCH